MMSTTKSRTETRGLSVRGPGPHPGLSPHCTEHTFRGGVTQPHLLSLHLEPMGHDERVSNPGGIRLDSLPDEGDRRWRMSMAMEKSPLVAR